jgi:hypothetical protein
LVTQFQDVLKLLGKNVLSRFPFSEILEEAGVSVSLGLNENPRKTRRKSQEQLGRDIKIMFPNEGLK